MLLKRGGINWATSNDAKFDIERLTDFLLQTRIIELFSQAVENQNKIKPQFPYTERKL